MVRWEYDEEIDMVYFKIPLSNDGLTKTC